MCRERIVDKFTPLDWIITGVIFAIGFIGAVVKVFAFDDPELKNRRKNNK